MKPVVIIGAGGHGKVLFDICHASARPVAGFLDESSSHQNNVHNVPILGSDDLLNDHSFVITHDFVIGVGETKIRRELISRLATIEASLALLIHPQAVVSDFASVGEGTTIHAGAIVNIDTRIGQHCVVNTAASVDHDCILENGVQICPGARLAGGVICKEYAFVGTSASVLPTVTVAQNAIVGAGAVVVSDIPANATVVGTPARMTHQKA